MSEQTEEILRVCEGLPPEKQRAVAEFARSLLAEGATGDGIWERIIADPKPRPKLEAFLKYSQLEGKTEPLDLNQL